MLRERGDIVRRGEGRHSDGMEGEKERSGGVGRGEPRLLRREEGRHSEGKEGEGRRGREGTESVGVWRLSPGLGVAVCGVGNWGREAEEKKEGIIGVFF